MHDFPKEIYTEKMRVSVLYKRFDLRSLAPVKLLPSYSTIIYTDMNVGLHTNRQLKLLYLKEEVGLENINKHYYNTKYRNPCTGLIKAQRFP